VRWIEQVLDAALERAPVPLPAAQGGEEARDAAPTATPAADADEPALIKH